MPAHIYLRTGRYRDASVANQNAAKTDESYFKGDRAPDNMTYDIGYYTHNIHFFVASASMEGRRGDALKAAEELRSKMHADMLRDPGMGGMVQHFHLTPLFVKLRFGMWDEILADDGPPADLPYMRAMWYAARGMALAARRELAGAERERAALAELKDRPELKTMFISSVNPAYSIVSIADDLLQADIARARGLVKETRGFLASAVGLEDRLTYMEPPDWPIPVRQLQGASLLEVGRAEEAEAAFSGDLRKFPENGWSLSGLQASLERQGKRPEAAAVRARLDRVWGGADTALAAARPRAEAVVPAAR
jgi:tetratricopeptide (TPR) repeat protein